MRAPALLAILLAAALGAFAVVQVADGLLVTHQTTVEPIELVPDPTTSTTVEPAPAPNPPAATTPPATTPPATNPPAPAPVVPQAPAAPPPDDDDDDDVDDDDDGGDDDGGDDDD